MIPQFISSHFSPKKCATVLVEIGRGRKPWQTLKEGGPMPPEIIKGLKDVYFDTTESSFIDGIEGKLLYRGYNIHDLAEKSTFEEVVYLLLYGDLPNTKELADSDAELRANRIIPNEVIQVLDLVKASHPMDALRTGISALSAFDSEVTDNSVEATIRKGIRLTAMGPTIVAAHHRLRQGLEPVAPNPDLNHVGNFLYMLFDELPDQETTDLLDVDFILHAEHGPNASAFAARVTASTVSDLHSAIVTGVGTLKGPAHGGAAEEVMKMALISATRRMPPSTPPSCWTTGTALWASATGSIKRKTLVPVTYVTAQRSLARKAAIPSGSRSCSTWKRTPCSPTGPRGSA